MFFLGHDSKTRPIPLETHYYYIWEIYYMSQNLIKLGFQDRIMRKWFLFKHRRQSTRCRMTDRISKRWSMFDFCFHFITWSIWGEHIRNITAYWPTPLTSNTHSLLHNIILEPTQQFKRLHSPAGCFQTAKILEAGQWLSWSDTHNNYQTINIMMQNTYEHHIDTYDRFRVRRPSFSPLWITQPFRQKFSEGYAEKSHQYSFRWPNTSGDFFLCLVSSALLQK